MTAIRALRYLGIAFAACAQLSLAASVGAAELQHPGMAARNPAPEYPIEARLDNEEGTVTVQALINAHGDPQEVRLGKSSGSSRLDRAAMTAVRGWKFIPARREGLPVAVWVNLPVVFRLEDAPRRPRPAASLPD